ncbi:retropepsin-like aspartic protease family protein [Allopontixanthobacter sp.]|uniref:retropepsin-like aspartic protease family protein n=1 Tax=Allopontixanthobacter sp. TaxID=2906452 RepID=UPI002AB879EE|nr:TIGR02281 family clan AA aspartic protease [Allopontixanthobacter sp.]MDZ4307904.1 TIGR02281 family clan AA aspartic protease [Allopontixanthobacter sp.]
MTLAEIWNALAAVIAEIPRSGLLVAVIGALLAGWIGAMMVRRRIPLGGLVSTASTVALAAILVTVVLQLSRFDSRVDFAIPEMGMPQQVVEGAETRIPMAPDGHFWLSAQVNGVPVAFMVDTGATLTAVSGRVADAAGLEPRRGGIPIRLNTANGSISAQITSIDELRFGTVTARGLDAVTAPNLGETNVIGMNLLSRLKSWRVEDNVLILVPNNPQPPVDAASGSY